jgi:hypothetical protein
MAKPKEMTGKKFGKWTVIKKDTNRTTPAVKWICECECGKLKSILGTTLRMGKSLSCKECWYRKYSLNKSSNYLGKINDEWEIIEVPLRARENGIVRCIKCGNNKSVRLNVYMKKNSPKCNMCLKFSKLEFPEI